MKNLFFIFIILSVIGCKSSFTNGIDVRTISSNSVISTTSGSVVNMNNVDTDTDVETDVETDEPVYIDYEEALTKSYKSQIGVREKTGRNDGKEVEMYLKSTGLGKGNPWCAAYVKWCLIQAGIPNTISAYSPTAYSKSRVSYKGGKWKREFRPGHVFTLYYQNLGRIGHTGFVDDIDGSIAITVEGNTNSAGSREGDGVFKKRRPLNGLYAICDWYPKK